MRKPNIHGGGSQTNINGLRFEERTDFLKSLRKDSNFQLIEEKPYKKTFQILYKEKKQGYYTEKHEFYNFFLKKEKINWENITSKKYLPDAVFINTKKNIVFIIEKKFQGGQGSVDEKLQTCDFKKKMYKKILSSSKTKFTVEYFYILSSFFKQQKYEDVKAYINEVGCKYFFEEINFNILGID